jgi:hypothetical protein
MGAGITQLYGLDDQWFESRHRLGIILLTTMSILVPGTTETPIQSVKRSSFPEGKAAET